MTCPFGVSMGSTSSSRPFIPSTVRPEPVEGWIKGEGDEFLDLYIALF